MKQRGFTLVELLVAISILAIVAVLGWRGLDGIIRSRSALTGEMEQTRGLQLAFAQMQSDCQNIATSTLLRGRAFLQAEDNRITLVRMVLAENEPTRLQVVSYRVRDGVLTRRESASTRDLLQLDALWQAALSDTDPAAGVALQSGVQAMAMRLWVPSPPGSTGSGTEAGSWRPAAGIATTGTLAAVAQAPMQTTPTVNTAALPNGLEVSLSLQGQALPMVKSFLLGAL